VVVLADTVLADPVQRWAGRLGIFPGSRGALGCRPVAALHRMLEHDRKQPAWSVGHTAWRLGVSVREYRELAGERVPSWETFDRICRLFGWPQTFGFSKRASDPGPVPRRSTRTP
jgi:hypothetical protein